jgi:DNA-directed RNA polymerase subunit RPC12/RpoP
MDESDINITRKGNKFIVTKNGKKSVYKSVDDMPPDVRETHERLQAFFKESFSDKTRFMEKEGRILKFYVNGKTYERIEDIPNPEDREYFLKKQEEASPDFMELPKDKKKKEEEERMGKLYPCSNCKKDVKVTKGFLGKLKCSECGTKIVP